MSQITVKPTRPNLAQYQRDILYCDARFTVTEASTKSGKTFSHIWWLFELAHGYEDGVKVLDVEDGMNFWWVAPVYGQAEIAYKRMWRKVRKTGVYTTNASNLTITTPYGTTIHFKTAKNADNLYGEDVYGAVFDEFTRAKVESWYALRTTLAYTKAPCKFIGNYTGNSNWGHQLGLKSETDPEYSYFKVNAWQAVEAGVLDRKEVEQAKKDLPAFMFKALFLAEGEIEQARLISDKAIKQLRRNDKVAEGEGYITADIAMQGSDKFIIGIWNGWILTDVYVIDKSDGHTVLGTIEQLANKHEIYAENICYDGDGLGQFLDGFLEHSVSFRNGGTPLKQNRQKVEFDNLKSQCYFHLAQQVNDRAVLIKADVDEYWGDIVEELEAVKNRNYGKDGKFGVLRKEELRNIIGRSPDFSDMLMMRCIFDLDNQYNAEYDFI